jgi:GGDEF domain-containing protein
MRFRHRARTSGSRVGHGTRRSALRIAGPLAGAVLCAAGIVAALEAAVLAGRTPWAPESGAGAVATCALLAAGAVLVVPLAMALAGWRLAERYDRALHDLDVDDLTGTGSRRAFGAALPEAVHAAEADGRPLTLALVELTDVVTAADVLGRRRVEALVAVAAATLAASAEAPTAGPAGRPAGGPAGRPTAGPAAGPATRTYRLGGELFAVLLPGVGPEAAIGAVDDLLAQVGRAAAPLAAAAGVCSLDARCPDPPLLLVGASAALDEARALGAGRVVASADEASGLRWLATPGTAGG